MYRFLRRFAGDQSGATALEYGLILALMFLVILSAVTAFANQGTGIFNTAMGKLAAAMGGAPG